MNIAWLYWKIFEEKKNNNQEFVINSLDTWYIIIEIRLIENWSSKFHITSYPCECVVIFVITTSKLTIRSTVSGADPITRVPRTIPYYCVILEPNLSSVSIPWNLTNRASNVAYAIAVNNLGILRLTNVWWCTMDCQRSFCSMHIFILTRRYSSFVRFLQLLQIVGNYCKLSLTKYSNTMISSISMGVVFELPLGISDSNYLIYNMYIVWYDIYICTYLMKW